VRTTLTLDADVEQLLRRAMQARGVSFKEAVNDGLRRGLRQRRPKETAVTTPTFDLGEPVVDLTKALALAGALEDEALAAKLQRGS